MAYESFISVEYVVYDSIDSHPWVILGKQFLPVGGISIYQFDDDVLASIVLSLFCDRRLLFAGDEPLTPGDRRGWWGDNTLQGNDLIGSRLWTLARHKMLGDKTKAEAEEILKEALQWLLDDKVAENIFITISQPYRDTLLFDISIKKPGDEKIGKYYFAWKITGNIIGA